MPDAMTGKIQLVLDRFNFDLVGALMSALSLEMIHYDDAGDLASRPQAL